MAEDDENRACHIDSSKRKVYSDSALKHAMNFSSDSAKDFHDDFIDSDASDVVNVLEKSEANAEFVSEFVKLPELEPWADKPGRRPRFRVLKKVSVIT
jgi:hypothetical protein